MKIYLHIGPHKTGTTSLQLWLNDVLPNDRVYYPEPEDFGPGHALLSWDALGLNGREIKDQVLIREVQNAHGAGCETIVFSSEEFSRGFVRGCVEPLARLKEEGELCVILTLNDLVDRFRAEVFELIKHKVHYPDIRQPDVLNCIMKRPGLRPDLVKQVRENIAPDRLVICIANKKNHQFVFDCFSRILGVEAPPKKQYSANQSSQYHTVQLLNTFNKLYPDLNTVDARRIAFKAAKLITAEFPTLEDQSFPGFDKETEFLLSSIWQLQCDHMRSLAELGRIELLQDE